MSFSALNHLKSELQRKKEDAEKQKRSIEAHHITPLSKTEREEESSSNDSKKLPELTEEEEMKAKKSRDILEAKAKLYDSLSEGVHLTKNSNLYLVNFEQKATEEAHVRSAVGASNPDRVIDLAKDIKGCDEASGKPMHSSSNRSLNEDQEPRKCSDKELLLKARNLSGPELSQKNESKLDVFEPTLISADMQRERKRQKWEEDEKLARSKDEIHYQDILFDEVRGHGVGYFAFSKDEEERRRQQAELEEMRKETLKKQEEFRKQRGDTSDESNSNRTSNESVEKTKPKKELTEEEKLKNIEEALKAIRREVHVRDWDKGKELPVMTQEEWMEKKRNERDSDFAPPQLYFDNQVQSNKQKRPVQLLPRKTLFQKKPDSNNVKTCEVEETEEKNGPATSITSPSILESISLPPDSDNTKPMVILTNSDSKDKEISHNTVLEGNKSSPVKAVKNTKKSAMAFLEQLNDSNVNEACSEQIDAVNNNSEIVSSIPLPQGSASSLDSEQNNTSSATVSCIPLPTENPVPPTTANNHAKRPFFIPSNLVPRRFTSNIKPKLDQTATPLCSDASKTPVTSPSTAVISSTKKLSNPFSDPKLSRYLKEPEILESVSCEDGEPNTANSNKNVSALPSDELSQPTVSCDLEDSSTNSEGSRIKLGNLIRNRPAPKSGMALLEEIKKSTRDFGPEAESSSNTSRASRKRGAEIAPPDCLFQITPQLPVKKIGLFSKKEQISDSISAGLQNLKNVVEKKNKKTREKGLLDIL